MSKAKLAIALLAIVLGACAVYFVLSSKHALVVHPKGVVAHRELSLIKTNIKLMLIVIIPTFILLFFTVWKYRASNKRSTYAPERSLGVFGQLMLWVIPSIVILVMSLITWRETHELDPRVPLQSEVKPLVIQVVALDWKWLFIYPEQGIATLNFFQFPAGTLIQLSLSADGSPMNSFWLPELSGQIYSMSGMVTTLHIMADAPGVFAGRAAEVNGKGLADMTFTAKSSTHEEFEAWVEQVRGSSLSMTRAVYEELAKRAINRQTLLYAHVEKNLFDKIVVKYMHPRKSVTCLED